MRLIIPIVSILISIFSIQLVRAESLSVSLQVGTTVVIFSGYTSPNSLVVTKESGSTIATTTSDINGHFTQNITVAVPALHSYELYITDPANNSSATTTYSLSVAGNTTTSINNIVIPPTITINNDLITGYASPESTLTLTSNLGDTATIYPNTNGSYSFDLTSISYGTHELTLTASIPPSYISISTTALTYTLSPVASTLPSSVAPSASTQTTDSSSATDNTPSPLPSPDTTPLPKPFFFRIYDTNDNGVLELSELFSIITKWLTKILPCDLNHDQKCNLIDLSILLYYIER